MPGGAPTHQTAHDEWQEYQSPGNDTNGNTHPTPPSSKTDSDHLPGKNKPTSNIRTTWREFAVWVIWRDLLSINQKKNSQWRKRSSRCAGKSGFSDARNSHIRPTRTFPNFFKTKATPGRISEIVQEVPLPPFDVHEVVSCVVSLAYAHSCIIIEDACGECLFLEARTAASTSNHQLDALVVEDAQASHRTE